jgi:hypothetical protein
MTRAGKAGIPGERRAGKIDYQFVARPIEMMESPAYRVLSFAARRVLDRIEIELGHHAGRGNGKLPVTYTHFVEYGIDRHAIRPALNELQALGIAVVTEPGCAGNAEHRAPNLLRLTYRNAGRERATNEWRRIKTMEEAEMIAQNARETARRTRRKWRVSKIFPSGGLRHVSVGHAPTETEKNGSESTLVSVGHAPTTSRFSGGTTETSSSAASTGSAAKPARKRKRRPKLVVTEIIEITDPAAIEATRRDAVRAMADAKCAKCQPDPFVITIGSKRVVTRDLKAA